MSGPISIGETVTSNVVKFKRKEFAELLREDREHVVRTQRSDSGVRHRRSLSHRSGRSVVAPAQSRGTSAKSAWLEEEVEEASGPR